jgi:hypothetical protein
MIARAKRMRRPPQERRRNSGRDGHGCHPARRLGALLGARGRISVHSGRLRRTGEGKRGTTENGKKAWKNGEFPP